MDEMTFRHFFGVFQLGCVTAVLSADASASLLVSVEHDARGRVPDLHAAALRRHEVLPARRDQRVRDVP